MYNNLDIIEVVVRSHVNLLIQYCFCVNYRELILGFLDILCNFDFQFNFCSL